MCNDYGNCIPYDAYLKAFSQLKIRLVAPGGPPNLEPRGDIWPTDVAPIGFVPIRRDMSFRSRYAGASKGYGIMRSGRRDPRSLWSKKNVRHQVTAAAHTSFVEHGLEVLLYG